MPRVWLQHIMVIMALSGVSGCVSTPERSVEETVAERAMAHMEALMALDYDTALSYMTPAYQASPRADRFRAEFSGAGWWQGVDFKWVKCSDVDGGTACTVRVIIKLFRPPAVTSPTPIPYETVWIPIDSVWYRTLD